MAANQTASVSHQRAQARHRKPYRGLAMEGAIARWYAKIKTSPAQLAQCQAEAARLTGKLEDGARILEVAPGPGVLSIELARSGRFLVTGTDVSQTFVELATERALRAGVRVAFQRGNASLLPFPAESFELVVTQAAFKNFSDPQGAILEMYRVLSPGGIAVIQDMRKEATDAQIREEVRGMNLGVLQRFMTRRTLHGLRRRAYTHERFEEFARASPFGRCEISTEGIGQEVRLGKPNGAQEAPERVC